MEQGGWCTSARSRSLGSVAMAVSNARLAAARCSAGGSEPPLAKATSDDPNSMSAAHCLRTILARCGASERPTL